MARGGVETCQNTEGHFGTVALWMFAGICWATEPLKPLPHFSTTALSLCRATRSEFDNDRRFDSVIVQAQGRGPQGYRYRIVLASATRGAVSALDLAADAGGLLVTARDVDGAGNDLDLIIKSAWSLTPVGVWINDHHGGFIKADARVYASSIWSECPLLLPVTHPMPCMEPFWYGTNPTINRLLSVAPASVGRTRLLLSSRASMCHHA